MLVFHFKVYYEKKGGLKILANNGGQIDWLNEFLEIQSERLRCQPRD
jgi:hypothetical protein